MNELRIEQKRAIFFLDSHIQSALGGFGRLQEIVALRTIYRDAYGGHLSKSGASEYVGPEVHTSVVLDDDEKASIAANRRLTVISEIEERLRDLGESIDELQLEVQRELGQAVA